MSKKYKIQSRTDPKYAETQAEIEEKWKVWREDLEKRRAEQRSRESAREAEQRKRQAVIDKRRAETKAKWEAKILPWKERRAKRRAWFKKTFTVERGRRNQIVKRTKQFVGAVVSAVILAATFFAVNYIALGLMVAIDWIILEGWKLFLGLVIVAAIGGLLYLLYILITSWGQAVVNKYNGGKRVWYVEPFIYLVWIPIKYIAIAIAYLFVNIIWALIKFIFYTALFTWFLKPIGLFIARVSVGLFKGVIGSTGIFGEYFGASYSDFCPGLEWVDFDED